MSWLWIGMISGTLLGLTGAGGAIISIPLLIHLNHLSFHEASVFSLVTVLISSALQWPLQRKNIHFRSAWLLCLFSVLGSHLVHPLKQSAPPWALTLLFEAVILFCLYLILRQGSVGPQIPVRKHSAAHLMLKTGAAGVILGVLVTLTGLGGGVILVPLFILFLHLPLEQAAATSLFTIFLSAAFNLWLQRHTVEAQFSLSVMIFLTAGCLISTLLTQWILKKTPLSRLNLLRKSLIVGIILFSAFTLMLHL